MKHNYEVATLRIICITYLKEEHIRFLRSYLWVFKQLVFSFAVVPSFKPPEIEMETSDQGTTGNHCNIAMTAYFIFLKMLKTFSKILDVKTIEYIFHYTSAFTFFT